MIFHVTSRQSWQQAQDSGELRPPSLAKEGFAHCASSAQLPGVLKRFFLGQNDLVALALDETKLDSPVRWEEGEVGETFPHVYGPIPAAAVVNAIAIPDQDIEDFLPPVALAASMASPCEIAHFVKDVEACTRFYRQLLGKGPEQRSDELAVFKTGRVKLMIHKRYKPEPEGLPCEDHIGFAAQDLDATFARLEQAGYEVVAAPREFKWGRCAYVRDPAGNLVELTA